MNLLIKTEEIITADDFLCFNDPKKEGCFEVPDGTGLHCRSFRCVVECSLSGHSETHPKMYLPYRNFSIRGKENNKKRLK